MDARRHLVLGALLLSSLLFLIAAPGVAQDDSVLTLLNPVTADLASGQSDRWSFTASSGAMLSFHLSTVSGNLDPVIAIEDGAGKIILRNDDYDPAATRDAVLEGVTLPDTGTYTVIVSAFGETGGTYELMMIPGYAVIEYQEQFDNAEAWGVVGENVEQVFGNNRMAMAVSGSQARAVATHLPGNDWREGYIRVEIPEIGGSAGWQTGIVARQQDAETYYLYAVDHRGQWRFTANTADGERVIRDWSGHPAILPGAIEFDLGLMMRDGTFEFFYNDQLIGRLVDDTLASTGQIGLMAQTPPGLESEVIAQFQNLTLTVPSAEEPAIPELLAVGDSAVMIQELQRRRLIPVTGEFRLIVPESFIMNNRPGVNHIRLGGDQVFDRFALGSTVAWEISESGSLTGCGVTLRERDENEYLLAYFDQTGAAGLSQRQGDEFEPGVFREDLEVSAGSQRLLVVADEERLLYYVNGQLAGALAREAVAGGAGIAAVNFGPGTTSCQYTDTWVWAWG